jgi:hypothetical protein
MEVGMALESLSRDEFKGLGKKAVVLPLLNNARVA